jgi:bacterioferritin
MKHAEAIAERLFYFDGTPTTKPTPIFVGTTLKEMMEQNVKDEAGAIKLYKKIIAKATEDGDESTALMFEDILRQEEDHHDTFSTLLEDL